MLNTCQFSHTRVYIDKEAEGMQMQLIEINKKKAGNN